MEKYGIYEKARESLLVLFSSYNLLLSSRRFGKNNTKNIYFVIYPGRLQDCW